MRLQYLETEHNNFMSGKLSAINKEAIERMRGRDYQGAAAILSEGMFLFEEILAMDEDSCFSTVGDEENSMMSVDEMDYKDEHFVFEEFAVACTPFILEGEDFFGQTKCSFTLFDKALAIPHNLSSADRDWDCTMICCILLYNRALCFHLQALACGDEAILNEALLLYEMAMRRVCLAGPSTMVQVLELVLLNNCGQIHSLRVSVRDVHAIVQQMHMLLTMLFRSSKDYQMPLSPFSCNVIYNSAQYTRPAPAA